MLTIDDARSWYDPDDPVHGFDHVLRVLQLAERIAEAEGADLEIVQAAALLHDAEGPGSDLSRKNHQEGSAKFAEEVLSKKGWSTERIKEVQHCIKAHRYRDQSTKHRTIEAKVLFDADKLDAIGAVGAIRAVSYAVLAHQNVFSLPSQKFMTSGEKEQGEAHTPYHEYIFKLQKLKNLMFTKSGIELAEGRHNFLESFFAQLIAELRFER